MASNTVTGNGSSTLGSTKTCELQRTPVTSPGFSAPRWHTTPSSRRSLIKSSTGRRSPSSAPYMANLTFGNILLTSAAIFTNVAGLFLECILAKNTTRGREPSQQARFSEGAMPFRTRSIGQITFRAASERDSTSVKASTAESLLRTVRVPIMSTSLTDMRVSGTTIPWGCATSVARRDRSPAGSCTRSRARWRCTTSAVRDSIQTRRSSDSERTEEKLLFSRTTR